MTSLLCKFVNKQLTNELHASVGVCLAANLPDVLQIFSENASELLGDSFLFAVESGDGKHHVVWVDVVADAVSVCHHWSVQHERICGR